MYTYVRVNARCSVCRTSCSASDKRCVSVIAFDNTPLQVSRCQRTWCLSPVFSISFLSVIFNGLHEQLITLTDFFQFFTYRISRSFGLDNVQIVDTWRRESEAAVLTTGMTVSHTSQFYRACPANVNSLALLLSTLEKWGI